MNKFCFMEVFLFNLFSFLIVITLIVFAHEFGHYYIAKLCGVKIEEFSIGMGREIYGFNDKHGTRWKFCWLPIGGYVKMFGDANAASQPEQNTMNYSDADKKLMMNFQSLPKKSAIVAAGPIANFIFTFILLVFSFITYGKIYATSEIGFIAEHSAAEKSGLQQGDVITDINGTKIKKFEDIVQLFQNVEYKSGDIFVITILRNGNEHIVPIEPQLIEETIANESNKKIRLGIGPKSTAYEKVIWYNAFSLAATTTYDFTVKIFYSLYELVTGQQSLKQLGGPVIIAKLSGDSVSQGLPTVIWFMAILSLNLGIINLLPIPMLDGGHLLLYLLEAMKGQPLSEKFQEYFFKLGLVFIIFLAIFITFNDLVNLKIF